MAGVKGRSGGHNAKTIEELALAGTFRNDRHAGVRSPEPPMGVPEPPKALRGQARLEWDRMIGRLASSKTLSSVDDGALYQYCQLFSETEAITTTKRANAGSIRLLVRQLKGMDGTDGANLALVATELAKLRRLEMAYTTQIRLGRALQRVFLAEFGLTPASRGRVKLPEKPPEEDPFDAFEGAGGTH